MNIRTVSARWFELVDDVLAAAKKIIINPEVFEDDKDEDGGRQFCKYEDLQNALHKLEQEFDDNH